VENGRNYRRGFDCFNHHIMRTEAEKAEIRKWFHDRETLWYHWPYRWKNKQWKNSKRIKIGPLTLSVWKWCGIVFPTWNLFFRDIPVIGFDIYHNGHGFLWNFGRWRGWIATTDRLAWWLGDVKVIISTPWKTYYLFGKLPS